MFVNHLVHPPSRPGPLGDGVPVEKVPRAGAEAKELDADDTEFCCLYPIQPDFPGEERRGEVECPAVVPRWRIVSVEQVHDLQIISIKILVLAMSGDKTINVCPQLDKKFLETNEMSVMANIYIIIIYMYTI